MPRWVQDGDLHPLQGAAHRLGQRGEELRRQRGHPGAGFTQAIGNVATGPGQAAPYQLGHVRPAAVATHGEVAQRAQGPEVAATVLQQVLEDDRASHQEVGAVALYQGVDEFRLDDMGCQDGRAMEAQGTEQAGVQPVAVIHRQDLEGNDLPLEGQAFQVHVDVAADRPVAEPDRLRMPGGTRGQYEQRILLRIGARQRIGD